MSLATRCPACGTVFRVVQDQLKVSDGWVRCGRCSEVFNALEGLFDLSRDSGPVPLDEPARTGPGAAPAASFTPPPADASAFTASAPVAASGSAAFAPGEADPVFEAPDLDLGAADPAATAHVPPPTGSVPHEADEIVFELAATADHPFAAHPPANQTDPVDALGVEPQADPEIDAAPAPDEAVAAAEPAGDGRVEPAFDAPDAWAPAPQDMSTAEVGADVDADGTAPARAATDSAVAGPSVVDDPLADPDASLSRPAFEDAQFPADALNEDPPVALSPAARRPRGKSAPAEAAVPGFVRRADRAARWQRPGVRVLLSLLVLVLTGTLAGQIAWHWRDRFAAQQPAWRPWLAQGCELLGCSLQPPRRPEALRVESSTLNKAGADVYRLTVVLRNTADHAVRAPHLDLTLTDNDGAVVARRAIGPELVTGAAAALDAQAEASWQLTLSSGGRRVSGYTVAAFYP